MLNAFSDIALASTLYLKTDDSINDFYKNQNTMNEIPYSMPPFALTVSKQDDLASTFKQSLAPGVKESRHQCIKKALGQPQKSANAIAKIITRELAVVATTPESNG